MKKDSLKSKMPTKLSKKAQKAADILALKADAHEAEMRVAAEIRARFERIDQRNERIEQRLDAVEKRPAGAKGDTGTTGPRGEKGEQGPKRTGWL